MSKNRSAPVQPVPGITGPYKDSANYLFLKARGRKVRLGRADDPRAQEEYQGFVQRWLAGNCQWPDETAAKDLDMSDLATGFMDYCRRYYGDGNRELVRVDVALRRLVKFVGARTKASEFDGKIFLAYRRALVAEGLAASTIRALTGVASRAIRWATAEGLAPAECWQRIQAVPGLRVGREGVRPATVRKPVPQEAIDAVLPYLPKPLAIAVQVLGLCGARPSELLSLRVGDLDQTQTGKVWTATLGEHKNKSKGKSRVLCFGPRCQALLRPLITFDRTAFLFDPAKAEEERNERRKASRKVKRWASHDVDLRKKRRGVPARVFSEHYTHKALSTAVTRAIGQANEAIKRDAIRDALLRAGVEGRAISQAITRLSRRPITTETASGVLLGDDATAGHATDALAALDRVVLVEPWHPYMLRHLCATRARREASLESARALLGHSRSNQTETYAALDQALAVAVAERLG